MRNLYKSPNGISIVQKLVLYQTGDRSIRVVIDEISSLMFKRVFIFWSLTFMDRMKHIFKFSRKLVYDSDF